MLLIKIFVKLRVAAGRSRTRAGSPQAVHRRPCCAVALRRKAWSEHGMGAAWAQPLKTFCIYLQSAPGNQIPALTGRTLSVGFSTRNRTFPQHWHA